MKNNKKIAFGLIVFLFVIAGVCNISNVIVLDDSDYTEMIPFIQTNKNDIDFPKISDYYDESAGIPIVGTTENIFSICQGYEHSYLYFYNISLDGSLYRIDLDNQIFTPTLIRGNLGTVYDIDTSYAPDGDMIFFATSEYDNAIMKMNVSLLVYEKILSSTWAPQKLSVDYDYRFGINIIAWITASNVFFWDGLNQVIENIETDFFGVIDIQCSEWNDILYYNDEEIVLYDAWEFADPHEKVRISGTGITSAFKKLYSDVIIYSQSGEIILFDYSDSTEIIIQAKEHLPVSVWCTGNYIYWLEQGYWSETSMIYQYATYGDNLCFKVSRAHGVQWADRIEFQFEESSNQRVLGVYWGYNQLYVINSTDITPPDTIEWMGGSDYNKTVNWDSWSTTWWNSWDLNGIKEYELIVSETEDFSDYDTYLISESEYSYTSLEFSDMKYGNYYYKIRAIDNTSFNYFDKPNIGDWSATLKVSYPNPVDPDGIPIFNLLIIIGIIGSISVISIISAIVIRKRINKKKI